MDVDVDVEGAARELMERTRVSPLSKGKDVEWGTPVPFVAPCAADVTAASTAVVVVVATAVSRVHTGQGKATGSI